MLKKIALAATGVATATAGAIVLPQAWAADDAATVTATVTVGSGYHLNVRTAPSGDAAVRSAFLDQDTIELHCRTEGDAVDGPDGSDTTWYGVKGDGYVAGAWLDQKADVPECHKDAQAPRYGITANGYGGSVNVRAGASDQAPAVSSIADGARSSADCWVQGTEHTNDAGHTTNWWFRVTGGFVSAAFIEPDPTAATLPICADAGATTPPEDLPEGPEPEPEQPAPEQQDPQQPAPEQDEPQDPAPQEPANPGESAEGDEYPFTGQFHLPMANGTSTVVTQAPFGTFSHDVGSGAPNNRHAIDLGLAEGTPLLATGPGKIVVASDRNDGYGSTVYIDHGNNRCTQLAHMSRIDVAVGDTVKTGDTVGAVGSTGMSTGAHLHWNVVACDGYTSLEVPDTVEQGTDYPEGATITSQNPGF